MAALLEIKNLHVSINGKEILKGVNLTINKGEKHALMGPNGNGKSTLAGVIAGRDIFDVTQGEIYYKGKILIYPSKTGLVRAFSWFSISSRNTRSKHDQFHAYRFE